MTAEDVTYNWLSETTLQASIRYPEMMNHPVEMVGLVTDDYGNIVFHEQHEALRGFEEDLASRRDADGEVYDRFTIAFEKPQDPQFVKLNQFLGGFDILNAQYSNRYNELCKFKMLQIVTKEMDVGQYKEGIATSNMSNLTLGRQQPRAPTHLPFGSPPPPMSAPMPAPVYSSMPMPAPPVHSMPMPAPTPAPVHSMPMPAQAQAQQARSQSELDVLQALQELKLDREKLEEDKKGWLTNYKQKGRPCRSSTMPN
jgi:hypothetical protein